MRTGVKLDRLAIIYGVLTAFALACYFMIMRWTGLAEILELRILNFFILAGGVLLAINKYKILSHERMGYLEGYGLGSAVTFISTFIFAAFMGFYLYFNPDFMAYIKQHALMGQYLTPFRAAIGLLLEGAASGVIASFMIMQYYKRYNYNMGDNKQTM